MIHIKRFTNFGNKIPDLIKYPASLSLQNYMSTAIDSSSKNSVNISTKDHEIYDLYGVVVH